MRPMIRTIAGRAARFGGFVERELGDQALLVTFHRVGPKAPHEDLVRRPEEYEAFCRFFRNDFDVVSLSSLLGLLETGESLEGKLVITHDDGYRDNFTHAAPILDKYGLPATIFVTTGFIDSKRVAWWDAELEARPEWMSWDEVRSLHRSGIEIGSHTVNHVNLGSVDEEEAVRELVDSRLELERQLGVECPLFAYPYGGAGNLTEENRDRVRAAGYRCCVSSFGGVCAPGTNPFMIPRVSMTPWYANVDQLALALAAGRT